VGGATAVATGIGAGTVGMNIGCGRRVAVVATVAGSIDETTRACAVDCSVYVMGATVECSVYTIGSALV